MADNMFTRQRLAGRIGRMEQLASIRRYSIEDGKGRGMRAFEVSNASGFEFMVYPDRGVDIGLARFPRAGHAWCS